MAGCILHCLRLSLRWLFPISNHDVLPDRSPYGLPLPAVPHLTISEEELGGRNIIIVGDVHGCYDELVELLDKCGANGPNTDRNTCVIFAGDLVNKGPKNASVVKCIRSMGCHTFCVRGNHDEVCLHAWQTYRSGSDPLGTEFEWMKELSREEMEWLEQLPYTIHIPSRRITVVHAGLIPGVPLNEQNPDHLIHLRNLKMNAETQQYVAVKKSEEGCVPWASAWPGPDHVYFGHDAIRFLQSYEFATGLDTGCVYGGKLTAVFPFESGRLVQVDPLRVYSPPKKGRTPNPATVDRP